MASTSALYKGELVNIPTPAFFTSLISSFPTEWQGVFGALNSETYPLHAATNWLKERQSDKGKTSIPPHWTKFIHHLVSEFPFVYMDDVCFKPKLLLLTINLQRNILSWIYYHFEDIELEIVEKLVRVLEKFSSEFSDWICVLHKQLKAKVVTVQLSQRECSRSGNGHATAGTYIELRNEDHTRQTVAYADVISEESRERFDDICKKLTVPDPSARWPGFDKVKWLPLDDELAHNIWDRRQEERERKSSNNSSSVNKSITAELGDGISKAEAMDVVSELLSVNTTQAEVICIDDDDDGSDANDDDGHENVKRQKYTTEWDVESLSESSVPLPPEDICDLELEADVMAELPDMTKSLIAKVTPLLSLLQSMDSGTDLNNPNQLCEQLTLLCECTSTDMEASCKYLNLKSATESSVVILCQQFVAMETDPSYSNALVFASHTILPKLEVLEQATSRVLFSAVMAFAKKHPKAFCDGVVLKLMTDVKLATFQTDFICKVIKDAFPVETVQHVFSEILKHQQNPSDMSWCDNVVTIVQTVIDTKLDIDPILFAQFSQVLDLNSRLLAKSLKFGKLVLAVINKHGSQALVHSKLFVDILDNNKTFLKKTGNAALKKLTK